MKTVSLAVLATVNAPYGTNLTREELARRLGDPTSADTCDAAVFCFLSEIDRKMQDRFVEEMGIDPGVVGTLAQTFEKMAGFELPMADRQKRITP